MRATRLRKILIGATAILLAACAFWGARPLPAHANSALREWKGTTAAGTQILDENCPLEVVRETLTFDISVFPYRSVGYDGEYYSYDELATVAAKYEFHNPTDIDVEASLAFPFGVVPSYAHRLPTPTEGTVTIDGAAADTTLRYTLYDMWNDNAIDGALSQMSDTYDEDDPLLRRDTPVYAYTYTFTGIRAGRGDSPFAVAIYPKGQDRKYIVSSTSYYNVGDRGIGDYVEEGSEITVYVLGGPLSAPLEWTVYNHGYEPTRKVLKGAQATLADKVPEMTFEDLAMRYRDENEGILPHDWYNMVVRNLKESYMTEVYLYSALKIREDTCMRWYTYTLSVPAHATVTNVVTAPLYPTIHYGSSPNIYTYDYYLSPASVWSSFGGIDIEVRTPYYLLDAYIGEDWTEFADGEEVYTFSANALPSGDLRLSVCTVPNPKRIKTSFEKFFVGAGIFILVWLCVVFVVTPIVVLTCYGVKKSRKRKTAADRTMSR